jgi:hypothetical protein
MTILTFVLDLTCCPVRMLLPARSTTPTDPPEDITVDAQCQRQPNHAGDHFVAQDLGGDKWIVLRTRWR